MGFGLRQLAELEPVAVLAAVVLEGPTAVLVGLGSTRILEHAVDRHELGNHQLAHSPVLSPEVWGLRPPECDELIAPGGVEAHCGSLALEWNVRPLLEVVAPTPERAQRH